MFMLLLSLRNKINKDILLFVSELRPSFSLQHTAICPLIEITEYEMIFHESSSVRENFHLL